MRANRGSFVLLALILTLALATGGVLGVDDWLQQRQAERAEEFQRLVGGLGFGPAVDLARCAFSFDPRLCSGCPQDLGPIPGGVYFCPQHACSILFYPRLEATRALSGETDGDALFP
jgi:hypothetical protein